MTKVYFKITDMNGNPIQNAKIQGQVECNPTGGGLTSITTNKEGKAVFDTGCTMGGHGVFTITALGYQDQILDLNFPICYPFTDCDLKQTVSLAKVYIPAPKQGAVNTQSGAKVQAATTESKFDQMVDYLKKNWWIPIAIIAVFLIILLMFRYRQPIARAARKGVKSSVGIIKNLAKVE